MSEEQTPYETELAQIAEEQEADVRWPPVSVTIEGPSYESCKALADLLKRIMLDGREADAQEAGTIRLVGFVDCPVEDFLNEMGKMDAEIARLADAMHDSEDERAKWFAQAIENNAVADALEKRLVEVEGRKLALAIAHGDAAPESYETRRKVVVEGVRQFSSGVRLAHRQRCRQQEDQDGERS